MNLIEALKTKKPIRRAGQGFRRCNEYERYVSEPTEDHSQFSVSDVMAEWEVLEEPEKAVHLTAEDFINAVFKVRQPVHMMSDPKLEGWRELMEELGLE